MIWSKEMLQNEFISRLKQKRQCGFSQEQHLTDNPCKKYMIQALVCKRERATVHAPCKQQITNFRAICVNISLTNHSKQYIFLKKWHF